MTDRPGCDTQRQDRDVDLLLGLPVQGDSGAKEETRRHSRQTRSSLQKAQAIKSKIFINIKSYGLQSRTWIATPIYFLSVNSLICSSNPIWNIHLVVFNKHCSCVYVCKSCILIRYTAVHYINIHAGAVNFVEIQIMHTNLAYETSAL